MASRLTGGWEKTKAWLNSVKFGLFMGDLESDFQTTAKSIEKSVMSAIVGQRFDWVPLANSTIAKKGHDAIYIETNFYLDSLDVKVSKSGRFNLELAVFPQGTHPSGIDMQTLARWLEFGTATIPARPLWRPALEEVSNSPEFKRLAKVSATLGFENFL